MPKDASIHSVLIIGSGPIIIGQACEFDYSGTQAARSLREEGIKVILINSNPATIMTDPRMADRVYLLPMNTASRWLLQEQPTHFWKAKSLPRKLDFHWSSGPLSRWVELVEALCTAKNSWMRR